MRVGSKELIRDINSHLLLEAIIQEGPVSRAALSKKTGLAKATVSAIVQELLEQKLVLEIGSDDTTLGRKPILLTFNEGCGHVLAIDVNTDTLSALTCNLKGESCRLRQFPNHAGRDEILPLLTSVIRQMTEELPKTPFGLVGIGLGIHGTVHRNEVTFIPYSPYEGLPFGAELEREFKVPVYLENEANLSVVGDNYFFFHVPDLIGVSVHAGVGVGIIIQNELYTGADGNAGEFGHTIIEMNGRPCPCGNQGCLEQYASERAILTQYALCTGQRDTDIDALVAACSRQEEKALSLLQDFVRYISVGINNLLNAFNPDVIVINSSFTSYFPEVLTQIRENLGNRAGRRCTLALSGLQDTSILLGAACLCIRNFLGIHHLRLDKVREE